MSIAHMTARARTHLGHLCADLPHRAVGSTSRGVNVNASGAVTPLLLAELLRD